jgi:predicted metal-dependent phosphoesterase TrpH
MESNINRVFLTLFMRTFLKADFHTHTKYSIEPKTFAFFEARARHGPEKLISTAIARGLDVLTITDHDTLRGAEIAEKYIKKNNIKDITFVKGEEVSSIEGHVIAVGIEEAIKPNLPAVETIDLIKKQGGAVIIPHPFSPYGMYNFIFNLKRFDGIEVFNPLACLVFGNRRAFNAAKKMGVAPIGSTDAHSLGIVGKVYTKVRCEGNVDSIIKAIKQRKTEACWTVKPHEILTTCLKDTSLFLVSWYGKPKV